MSAATDDATDERPDLIPVDPNSSLTPSSSFPNVHTDLTWPVFVEVSPGVRHYTGRYTPCDEATAKRFPVYAVLHVEAVNGNVAALPIFVASRDSKSTKYEATHSLLGSSSHAEEGDIWIVTVRKRINELRLLGSYLNGQLIPTGYRVKEIRLIERIAPWKIDSLPHGYENIRQSTVNTISVPIDEELWQQGFARQEDTNLSSI